MTRHLRPTTAAMAVAVAMLATTGCGDDGGAASDLAAQLDGREFLSENVEGREMVAGTRIRISFNDGNISAHAGCNTIGGPVSIVDGLLVAEDELFTTAMGCDAPEMGQDDWLRRVLQGGPRVSLDGDRLVITAADQTLDLLDREVADPDRPLTGTVWAIDTVLEGEGASSVPSGSAVTLVVREDSTAALVSEGCGSIDLSADVDADAGELRFGALSGELADCPSPWGETVELLRADAVTYEIEANRLTLSAGGRGIAATADEG